MGTLLEMKAHTRREPQTGRQSGNRECQIVIFPGVRIERHELDLAHRMKDSAGRDDFGGRPRKTS